jgi:protein-tyrosine phosphatase
VEIIDNLYLSDLNSIQKGEGKGQLICVLENLPEVEPENALWVPILRRRYEKVKIKPNQDYEWREYISHAIPQQLDLVAEITDKYRKKNIPVTIHCAAGEERSPLAVIWYLYKFGHAKSLEQAFEIVKAKKPDIINRLEWIPKSVLE